MDIGAWLRLLDLEQYAAAFAEHDIDGETLVRLTSEDLRELGVGSVGHRRRLLDAIAQLRADTQGPGTETRGSSPDAERRQLTVMFCDLVGSTQLAEALDPEVMREVIRSYQDAVTQEITRFDGSVTKFMGDGVLAYFGWPQAHEDDAERAVRSGLAIARAIGQLHTPAGAPLQVRVGIATGLVVVGDLIGEGGAQEELVVGGTPNLAARLQGLAAGNGVVIAEGTRNLLGERFAYADLGMQDLRGFTEPQGAWRVIRSLELESRFEATRGPRMTPLVGRTEELDLLRRRWQAVKRNEGQVVLLMGEAGIGKSRIAVAFDERIADDPHIRLLYQCSPYHTNSALYPFIQQLERAAAFGREDKDEEKLDKLEALLAPSTAQPSKVAALIAPLLSIATGARDPRLTMSPQRQKEESLRALLEQLESLAARHPVLLIFEDVHWLDPTSQELLELMVERAQHLPVLLTITFRPEYAQPWSGQAHVTLLALNRLSHDLGAAMVRELGGSKTLPEEIQQQIVGKTDGIPLFIEELTKTVLDSGLLEEKSDRYSLAGELPAHAIPASLQDSLMARLDQLANVKEVAQIGAVIGREFSYELLSKISSLTEDELVESLERLGRSGLVFRRGQLPHARFLFKHALVRDAAYESLLKGLRQRLHAEIAQAMEEHFAARSEAEPEVLAHHFTEAGLVKQAVTYWRRAGERAVAQSAHAEAIGHLQKGLELLEGAPDGQERNRDELELQSALGPPLIATKGYGAPEVAEVYTRARELCRVEDIVHLCPIMYGLWTYYTTRADYERSRGLSADLLEAAEKSRKPELLLDAHVAMSCTSFFTGEFVSAGESSTRGMKLYDPERHRAHALQNPGVVCGTVNATALWYLGYPDKALTESRKTLSLARDLSHPFSLVVALTWFSMLHHYRQEASTARKLSEEAMAISEEQGFASWFAAAAMVNGWASAAQGQHDVARARVSESLDLSNAVGSLIWRPYQLSLLAEVHISAGRHEESGELLTKARDAAMTTGERYWEAELHRQEADLRLTGPRCDPGGAEACFQRALKVARRQQAKSLELRAAIGLCRLWRRQGRRAEARSLLSPLYGWFTEGVETADLRQARTLLEEIS